MVPYRVGGPHSSTTVYYAHAQQWGQVLVLSDIPLVTTSIYAIVQLEGIHAVEQSDCLLETSAILGILHFYIRIYVSFIYNFRAY